MRMAKDGTHTRYRITREDNDLEKWLRENEPTDYSQTNFMAYPRLRIEGSLSSCGPVVPTFSFSKHQH